MALLKQTLDTEVSTIFGSLWETRAGRDVPDAETVGLGNKGVTIQATVLYADLAGSTAMVDSYPDWFAAEVYKTYLICCARLVRDEGGAITAYDGDRIMAVYVGGEKNRQATRTALRINSAIEEVVRPLMAAQYPNTTFKVEGKVGIDTSPLLVAKTGIRGHNDLVWVGRAANHAAKMAALSTGYSIYISEDVYNDLDASFWRAKAPPHANPWTSLTGFSGGPPIYGTTYKWTHL